MRRSNLMVTLSFVLSLIMPVFAGATSASAQASDEAIAAKETLQAIYLEDGEDAATEYFASLDRAIQDEVILLSTPVNSDTVVKTEKVFLPSNEGSLSGCWQTTRSKTWESYLGADLYSLSQTIGWCYSGGIYGNWCSANASAHDFFWDVTGTNYYCIITYGGGGDSSVKYESSYTYQGCVPFEGCFSTEVEWIAMQGWDNGGFIWWVS